MAITHGKFQFVVDDNNIYSKNKYLDVNLTKCVQDLYAENYTMMMKEIKEDLKTGETYNFQEWKTQHSKVSSPQVDKQLNVIPIKLQQDSSRYKQDYF